MTVDLAETAHHAVTGGVFDQVFHRAPPPLTGDHHRAVLDERPVIAEVGDVFTGGAVTRLASFCDRFRTIFVIARGPTVVHLLQVRAHVIEILFVIVA